MDNDSNDSQSDENIPTHVLVQRQLSDLIAIQKARVARLEEDVSLQNETLREHYVSKDQYDADVTRLQVKIIEDYVTHHSKRGFARKFGLKCEDMESLVTEYVPKEQYQSVVAQLEEEKREHGDTRRRLKEITDKLEEAFQEMAILNTQLEKEREAFKKACGSLKSRKMEETSKIMKLETKCAEISGQCEKQEEILVAKNQEVSALERRLKAREDMYKKELNETEIERKQQRYITKMMEEQGRKNTRPVHQGVPKTKISKR